MTKPGFKAHVREIEARGLLDVETGLPPGAGSRERVQSQSARLYGQIRRGPTRPSTPSGSAKIYLG